MTTPAPQSPPPFLSDRTLCDLDLGCRVGLLVLTALLTYVSVHLSCSFSTGGTAREYLTHRSLRRLPLPITQLAQSGSQTCLLLSCLLSAIALSAACLVRRPRTALLTISACNLALGALAWFLITALWMGIARIG